MKLVSYFLLAMLTFAVAGCKKDKDDDKDGTGNNTPINTTVSLTATAGASTYQAAAFQHQLTDGVHVFTTQSLDGRTMTLFLSDLSVGTRSFNFDDPAILYTTGSISFNAGNAPSGSITITSNVNNRISGTFQTTLHDLAFTGSSIVISNGSFNAIAYN